MNLDRMLDKCQKGQWNVNDFDWTQKPASLSRFDEMEACQAFTNLIYIERIAAAAFLEFAKQAADPTEKAIFGTFYDDEIRHAEAMWHLAKYFDVHQYRIYTPDPNLVKFVRAMSEMINGISPEFASAMVTAGELVLDVALLRSVNDYIEDPLSRAVIEKVNQDESRHIAMDFYLCEKYGQEAGEPPSLKDFFDTMSNPTLVSGMYWATVALSEMFGRIQAIMDPAGTRFIEAQRRFAMLGEKNPKIAANRNYAAVLRINTVSQDFFGGLRRIMQLLRVGLFREMKEAEKRGEKRKAPRQSAGHDPVKTAVDLLEEMN
ncbi:MAG: ferritin-like domain-containing protein [Deltaproteobacteria bacterium]|nr:ferritin-like domain-containing protein [Deltaproteobacteria bacterium]